MLALARDRMTWRYATLLPQSMLVRRSRTLESRSHRHRPESETMRPGTGIRLSASVRRGPGCHVQTRLWPVLASTFMSASPARKIPGSVELDGSEVPAEEFELEVAIVASGFSFLRDGRNSPCALLRTIHSQSVHCA